MYINTIIIGSGSYIPEIVVKNDDFLSHEFYDESGVQFEQDNRETIDKFKEITGISERRYLSDDLNNSDMAFFAAQKAIEDADIDPESLDYIILGHNFGDILEDNWKTDMVPSISARVKNKLDIKNPYCIPLDVPFGCPGWLQGFIMADIFMKSGHAKKALVIGSESLSRIVDPHNRDTMIFSDGAGAVVLEAKESEDQFGVISSKTRSDTKGEFLNLLDMQKSLNPDYKDDTLFLRMKGRKLYNYSLKTVPPLVKEVIDEAGIGIDQIQKILIHQANEKMDDAMVRGLFKLYGLRDYPKEVLPMSIAHLGNNSVATIPILYDLISKGMTDSNSYKSGDYVVFVSVGAGLYINAMVYLVP
jgi:3-oxoacyl-[acyl-carrier-protein] synthase-3